MTTNWTSLARRYEIVEDPNETAAEAQIRQANAQEYSNAVVTLQRKWTETYRDTHRATALQEGRNAQIREVCDLGQLVHQRCLRVFLWTFARYR